MSELLQLTIYRKHYYDDTTIGELHIDGEFFCYTLEDTVRPFGIKANRNTAIWEGTYKVVLEYSPRFKRIMPTILEVPYFEGIRIHGGNRHEDTDGCPLVGFKCAGKLIWGSAERELTERLKGKTVILTIKNMINVEVDKILFGGNCE